MRRKGRWVIRGGGETGDDMEPLSESVEGKNNGVEDDMAWDAMWEMTLV
jgi:hypothetical protein